MKAAAAGSAAAGTLWTMKAFPVAKILWTLPVLAMTALFATKEFSPEAAKTAQALDLCSARLSEISLERDEIRNRQTDGSLLKGLTAASFGVEVKAGNEDILRMSPAALALQVQQLREIVVRYSADTRRMAEEKRQLAQEKLRVVDALAKSAVVSSSEKADTCVACEAKLAAAQLVMASRQDELEAARTEHMRTKASLDEARDQLRLADATLVDAKASHVNTQSKLQHARNQLANCVALATATEKERNFQGNLCEASREDMQRYLDYAPHGACPNDWYFVQRLIFKKNCFSLPRRRCRAVTPRHPSEPLPLPRSLFQQRALKDRNVRWDLHQCKSFACLNARTQGDCRQCFNLTLEATRWQHPFRGTLPIKEVIAMKKGTLRIGLDVGGGTGSFAAHMAQFGVTIMTTAFNVETIAGAKAGLPYMEVIAARGLIPLHVPHRSRLPLYDGVLDVIHSVNSIKYIPLVQFEELIYEWDRVLRVGGIFWFEMFYAPVEDMPKYVAIIERLSYKKLYWNFTPKPDIGELGGAHVYLNCVLEKQASPGKETLSGPRPEDMQGIV